MDFLKGKQRDDDLVSLAKFHTPSEAHSVRLLLQAHGIAATVHNEESNALFGTSLLGQTGLFSVEVFVKRAEFEEAKIIMDEVPAAAETLIPQWTCDCGENVDSGFSVCWSCGCDHPEANEA